MTSEKRHIPINHNGAPAGRPDGQKAGPGATSGAKAAGAGSSQAPAPPTAGTGGAEIQALRAELESLAADVEKLSTERDALEKERDALEKERDALEKERDALVDSRLRLQAEFANFRKRATRESCEARDRAQCDLLTDLLPVLDNLERALDAAEHHEEGKVLGGVRMTRDMFIDLLARIGVEEVEGVGAEFDPQVHDAMLVQPSDQEEGVVTAVLERGYRQGDRVLRPARVVVSAGPNGTAGGSGGSTGGLGGTAV